MKRISLAATMVAGCVAAALPTAVWAVNPTNTSNSTLSPQSTAPYGSMVLPGQGLYNFNTGTGSTIDPLYNSNLYTTPTYPGYVDPLARVAPTPDFNLNPGGRDRLNPQIAPGYVPPGQGSTTNLRKWKLGVYSKDLDTGVRIYDIVQGGAAHRAGLEVNDQIISVNGFQVGYINGQLYDCGTEFDRLADQNGWVMLLVQNNRDRTLVNVPVQLESRLSTLTGSIALANRQTLPSNAIINVELREILNNAPQGVTFMSRRIDNLNQYPIPFSIDFDPAQIVNGRQYVIYANAIVNGRETHRTPELVRVLNTSGQIRPVTLQLVQVAASNTYPTAPGYGQQVSYNSNDAQVAQIVKWFNDYLGRNPSDRELVTWMQQLNQGQAISQVQLSLLANEQFFNRCDADKRVYVTRMHELLIGRSPTPEELAYWVSRYDAQNGIRRDLAREFQGALGIR